MTKVGSPEVTRHQLTADNAVAVEERAKAESEGAEKERAKINEISRSQHQTSRFRNHDVAGIGDTGNLLLSHAWCRLHAQDGSSVCERAGQPARRQRGGSRIDAVKSSRRNAQLL